MEPVNLVCVRQGTKFGPEYVYILKDMLERNIQDTKYNFICFTDKPEEIPGVETRPLPGNLEGWWNKLYLFSADAGLKGQTFFFDLDTIIVDKIDDYLQYNGRFLILRDFYRPKGLGSGLMSWEEGFGTYLWDEFVHQGYPSLTGGDQEFIEKNLTHEDLTALDIYQDLLCARGQIKSYKVDCERWPSGKIVCFHGRPMPHEVKGSWVEQFWRIGGVRGIQINDKVMNIPPSQAVENMRQNCHLELPWFFQRSPHSKRICIVGGGPSLKRNLGNLKRHIRLGADVMSLNGTLPFLVERGVKPKFHCQFDARPENVEFVKNAPKDTIYLIGSMSDPCVFEELKNKNVHLWHADICQEEQIKILDEWPQKPGMLVGGGGTVGLRAQLLAYFAGYRNIVLYGMDSSYEDADHHAYKQELNDLDGRCSLWALGREYHCAPWMMRQAEEFKYFYRKLLDLGCTIEAVGDGLLPDICRDLNRQVKEFRNAQCA